MKKQIFALTMAATMSFSSQAEVIKYQSNTVSSNIKNQLSELNLGLSDVEGMTAWLETDNSGSERRFTLKRLVIDMRRSQDLVINNIDHPDHNEYFVANAPGWMFKNIDIDGKVKTNMGSPELQLTLSVPKEGTGEYDRKLELVEFHAHQLNRAGKNPVVDVARVKYKDKPVTLKLLEFKQQVNEYDHEKKYVIDSQWMGYGRKLLTFDFYPASPRTSLVGITVIEFPKSDQEVDFDVKIRYTDDSGSIQEHHAGVLSDMLSVYKR